MLAFVPSSNRLRIVAGLVCLAVLGVVCWRWLALDDPQTEARRHAGELTGLPGLPGEAPVIAAPTVSSADARARNAAAPFYSGKISPAPPFRFSGSPRDQSRAVECLALAAMAEAGGSDAGQRAVIQVVLNRVRHPAFAKSICGVVFEGAERSTGCQFSFTCDGSLARRYNEAQWILARHRAAEMLAGAVYRPVGNATHYHTDWVYPYWSPKLVKLARVDTHLFFRWPGYWGSSRAMRIAYRGNEPDALAAAATNLAAPASAPAPDLPADTPKVSGGAVAMRDPSGRGNFIQIDPATDANGVLLIARRLCKPNATCRVLGWASAEQIPAALPIPREARATLQFSFTREPDGREIALFDCTRFGGLPTDQCIPRPRP